MPLRHDDLELSLGEVQLDDLTIRSTNTFAIGALLQEITLVTRVCVTNINMV